MFTGLLSRLFTRELRHTSLVVQCAGKDDSVILDLADRMDRLYGENSAQGNKLRTYVDGRKRHFAPANF